MGRYSSYGDTKITRLRPKKSKIRYIMNEAQFSKEFGYAWWNAKIPDGIVFCPSIKYKGILFYEEHP